MKAIHQIIEHLRERGRLSRRQLADLTAKGYWGLMQPDELRSVERKVGQSFPFQVTGNNLGPIWGTDVYTTDSNLGTACVHAGLLKVGEAGTVKVTIVEPVAIFHASIRNGITSQSWQTGWGGAFMVERN
ncbi:MAG TPA: LCCL domain-containing protein [Gemmataceae bacterium]|nr:LCCL domain-containing protein [Gemmataceae bacterium]